MRELELKYGCNPNQKPSRIYMEEGELPIKVRLDASRTVAKASGMILSRDSPHKYLKILALIFYMN